jgi:type I restriction enzyme S subunit
MSIMFQSTSDAAHRRPDFTALGEVIEFRNEIIHPKNRPKGIVTFVGLEHIESDTGVRIGSVQVRLEEMTGRRARFRAGDIVYGYLRPYLNKVWIAEFEGICSVDQYVFKVRSIADRNYVAHFLRSPEFLRTAPVDSTPGQLPRIRSGEIAGTRIPFPSPDEQRRIAVILDQADDLRRKRREALGKLDSLTMGFFTTLVDNGGAAHQVGLSEVCQFISGNSLPSGMPFAGQVDGCLLLKVSDLGSEANDPVVWQAKEWIEVPPRSHASLVAPALSVAFPKRGGAIATNKKRRLGRAAILDPNLMAVAVKEPRTLHPTYLSYWFERLDLVSISSGSAVPQLNKQDLDRLTITLPPFDAQCAFAARVAEIDKLKAVHRAHLAKLDALFVSLQHRAFRGEL